MSRVRILSRQHGDTVDLMFILPDDSFLTAQFTVTVNILTERTEEKLKRLGFTPLEATAWEPNELIIQRERNILGESLQAKRKQ